MSIISLGKRALSFTIRNKCTKSEIHAELGRAKIAEQPEDVCVSIEACRLAHRIQDKMKFLSNTPEPLIPNKFNLYLTVPRLDCFERVDLAASRISKTRDYRAKRSRRPFFSQFREKVPLKWKRYKLRSVEI